MRVKFKQLPVLLFLFVASLVIAASSPLLLVQDTANQMLQSLQEHKATIKTHRAEVYKIVEDILLPHVDVEAMSRSVLGRNVWTKATPDQQARFSEAFTTLLVHTYSSALAAYTNETIKFYPIRGGVTGNRVQVQSVIIRQNGPSIPVNYRLVAVGDSWKIYDFSIEGVSILESFRSQFEHDIAQQGLDNLIEKLIQHNQGR
jgi:phospholipid transport system substrate-binding protein